MQFTSASSRIQSADSALDEIFEALPSGPLNLAAVFLDAQHRAAPIHRKRDLRTDQRPTVLLGDPFSTAPGHVLHAINAHLPGLPAFGGMASGASRPWDNALLINDELHTAGLVGFSISGDIEVEG